MTKLRNFLEKELSFVFVCPALMWQFLFLYVPLFILFLHSVFKSLPSGGFFFTLERFKQIFQPVSFKILSASFVLAVETAILCLLIAYPLAYFLTFKVKRFRSFFLMLLILPSWTSWIVQIYAWFFLLKKDGIISALLVKFGICSAPIHLLNNQFAVLVGMVYCYLPFMILPIYSILEKIDRRVVEASSDLGASRWVTIQRVIIPLSSSGIIAGLFLVFIPAFGEFAIPEFLGGSKKMFWGNVIVSKFLDYRDWPSGAAATYIGLLFPVAMIVLLYLIIRVMRWGLVRPVTRTSLFQRLRRKLHG